MTERPEDEPKRQRVERVSGARRARLTPVPGSDPEPESAPGSDEEPASTGERRPRGPKGPNDDRLIQDVPPHY